MGSLVATDVLSVVTYYAKHYRASLSLQAERSGHMERMVTFPESCDRVMGVEARTKDEEGKDF